ncbi:competence protein ComK [Erysipelotrichaceae bacterium OttesenSCG-928-M19]|nr:competence protein ComK [Erysipelotrichaceae bacterium OttesenSCG-928-M19]
MNFNVIYTDNNKVYLYKNGEKRELNEKIDYYLERLCLSCGATFKGNMAASKKMLPRSKKVPIYIASLNDYLIPLASPANSDCLWIKASNYLTCYELDGQSYIKFKDRSVLEVVFSTFTIRMQYQKYCELEQKRNEMTMIDGFY